MNKICRNCKHWGGTGVELAPCDHTASVRGASSTCDEWETKETQPQQVARTAGITVETARKWIREHGFDAAMRKRPMSRSDRGKRSRLFSSWGEGFRLPGSPMR